MGNKRKHFSASKCKKKMTSTRVAKRTKIGLQSEQLSAPNDTLADSCTDKGSSETIDIFSSLIKDIEEIQEHDVENSTIQDYQISVDSNSPSSAQYRIDGRRIVDFNNFFERLTTISQHNPGLGCSLSNIKIIKEKLIGLESVIYFQCNMCNEKFDIKTSDNLADNMSVSHAAVPGAMLIGCGRTNLNELFTAMDLPNLNNKTYKQCHNEVSDWWAVAAENSMKEAAREEAELAIENGDLIDGFPTIAVVADACWSKRSYRTNYTAASGAAAIIGLETGKVLYMAVKNKYGIICARAVIKRQPPIAHNCTSNHSGSSTAMEQTSIVEGFKSSIATDNLIYKTLVADGDASTYKKY